MDKKSKEKVQKKILKLYGTSNKFYHGFKCPMTLPFQKPSKYLNEIYFCCFYQLTIYESVTALGFQIHGFQNKFSSKERGNYDLKCKTIQAAPLFIFS